MRGAAAIFGGLLTAAPVLAEAPAFCADRDRGRFGAMTTGAWQEGPIRKFYEGRVRADASGNPRYPDVDRFVLLHCPSRAFVEVTGFRPFDWADDSPEGDPDYRADIDLHGAIGRITTDAVESAERVTLDELARRYRGAGLAARVGRDYGATCLCD